MTRKEILYKRNRTIPKLLNCISIFIQPYGKIKFLKIDVVVNQEKNPNHWMHHKTYNYMHTLFFKEVEK